MTIAAGTRIGPYEVVALLGAGGMGEVYRARDERLSRDVAVKVLPEGFALDPDRMRRFEQEARAAGQINHPAIMAVYDVGTFEGTPYIVSEYIEGETLREILDSGPLPNRRAVELGIEIASGLAAAHAKGIVHRDLKPENLILLRDGRVKILDFGIAKLTRDGRGKVSDTGPTLQNLTVTGQLLGTASYMAPEQIRDHGVDHRTDLFTLGAILYEMLTGAHAFPGETVADRMSAILRSEPLALPPALDTAYPGLGKVLRRCLEKNPDTRIDSARDLALALELVLEKGSGPVATTSAASSIEDLAFRRLTFRDGEISGARFTPDGQTVIYSASWEGALEEIYQVRVELPESRSVGLKGQTLLSVSPTTELAVALGVIDIGGFIRLGTLARVPMVGGVPREILGGVFFADWAPDGRSLAVVRDIEGNLRLEFPIGKVLHRPSGWMSDVRVSRDGKRIAVLEHPYRGDNGGNVVEVDLQGRARTLSSGWATLGGMAWGQDGTLWFSGVRIGTSPALYSISPDGVLRTRYRPTGYPMIYDVSASGDALISQETPRMKMEWRGPEDEQPRDLSWLDWSLARDISPDGKWVLFDETGLGAEGGWSVYMRSTDGAPAVRLGHGVADEFSPDGRWALSLDRSTNTPILHPTGAGETQVLTMGHVVYHRGTWFPDGKAICVSASEPGSLGRLYRFDLRGRTLEPFTGEGVGRILCRVSPDGRFAIASDASGMFGLYPTDGGSPRTLDFVAPDERPVAWDSDGQGIIIFERGKIPSRVYRVDLATGRREQRLEIHPRQRSGVDGINSVCLSPDKRSYVASYVQVLSELYLVRGLQ